MESEGEKGQLAHILIYQIGAHCLLCTVCPTSRQPYTTYLICGLCVSARLEQNAHDGNIWFERFVHNLNECRAPILPCDEPVIQASNMKTTGFKEL